MMFALLALAFMVIGAHVVVISLCIVAARADERHDMQVLNERQ